MIARAFLVKPRLIIADEPVSMVDASLRASILDVFVRLKEEGAVILYITHDLSTVYRVADELLVLYAGSLVERGAARAVIEHPTHPYTQLLVDSVPSTDPSVRWGPVRERASTISGVPKDGCPFHPRCPFRMDVCVVTPPPLYAAGRPGQRSACYLHAPEIERP